jgi:tryptophanase
MPKYAIPPYKIKMVESISLIPRSEREKRLKEAGYNPFRLRAEDVFIDLLTDSGTGAMSDHQWGAMMIGDESYAGSKSFFKLEKVVQTITGYNYIIPVHQGRGAEQVVLPLLVEHPNMIFISNTHFDTTRAHVELSGARAIDTPGEHTYQINVYDDFKGNFDLKKLEETIQSAGKDNVAGIIMTITNNSAGGQPVSLENIRAVSAIAQKYGILRIIDGARYAENAYFIKRRESAYRDHTIRQIAKEMFDCADVLLMSSKKDGLVNIGGLIAIKDNFALFQQAQTRVVPYEGFPTYGGLAGRDMEALAVGLQEALDERYLEYRIDEVRYLGDLLRQHGIPIQYPTGGHAVFVDCGALCPQIPYDQFPAQAVCNELYLEGGVRAVEIGSLLLGRDPDTKLNLHAPLELLRLTIPRRTYMFEHWDYVAEVFERVYRRRHQIVGLEFTYESPVLRHFTAQFRPIQK